MSSPPNPPTPATTGSPPSRANTTSVYTRISRGHTDVERGFADFARTGDS
jgi:hypothetical protein